MNNVSIEKNPRIDVADVLRGLAIMGIIILHTIEHFNFYSFPDTSTQSSFLNFTDKAIWDGLFFLYGGKAYAVFALLFGFSFFIQDDNQQKRGKDFRLRFMWRLVLLFIIGNFNAAFFTAEILVMYALIGFVLVAVCRLSDKIVFGIAVILMLQPIEWGKMMYAFMNPGLDPGDSLAIHYFNIAFEFQKNGNFLEMVKVNLWEGQLANMSWAWEHGRIFQTAALFMFGMLVGRKGLFLNSEKNVMFWLKTLGISLICYFPLTGLKNLLPEFIENAMALQSLDTILYSLSNLAFMLVLVSGVILAFYLSGLKKLFLKITPYGKMSLTNYITQSIIGSLLFYNWGFGLHDKLGITYSFLVGIGLFILQFLFCTWWMKHHKHGPFEGLWRKGTWIGTKR